MWALPAGTVLPSVWLSSCTKPEIIPKKSYTGRVGVLGAGVAGLQAALALKERGVEVILMDPSDRIGGRVRSQTTSGAVLQARHLELGADFIFGQNSFAYQAARSSSEQIIHADGTIGYYVAQEDASSVSDVSNDKHYKDFLDFRKKMLQSTGKPGDTLSSFINSALEEELGKVDAEEARLGVQNTFESIRTLVEGAVANTYGTTLEQLTLGEFIDIERQRTSTTKPFYLSNRTLYDTIKAYYAGLDTNIRRGTATGIDHSGDKVKISFEEEGDPEEVDKLVLALPLSAVKQRVSFTPALPKEKLDALAKMESSGCLKIFLRLNERVWSDRLRYLYFPTAISKVVAHPTEHILMGYVFGDRVGSFLENGEAKAAEIFIQMLDGFFGQEQVSNRLVSSSGGGEVKIYSWAENSEDVPHIREAYSYVRTGETNVRTMLARPLDNKKLFFAGEYTHDKGHAGTVHGAMETGYRAAVEVLQSI